MLTNALSPDTSNSDAALSPRNVSEHLSLSTSIKPELNLYSKFLFKSTPGFVLIN